MIRSLALNSEKRLAARRPFQARTSRARPVSAARYLSVHHLSKASHLKCCPTFSGRVSGGGMGLTSKTLSDVHHSLVIAQLKDGTSKIRVPDSNRRSPILMRRPQDCIFQASRHSDGKQKSSNITVALVLWGEVALLRRRPQMNFA